VRPALLSFVSLSGLRSSLADSLPLLTVATGYGYTEEQQEWFYERGCEWIKVCANPGDLILVRLALPPRASLSSLELTIRLDRLQWDSRALHYNRPPSGDRTRMCASSLSLSRSRSFVTS